MPKLSTPSYLGIDPGQNGGAAVVSSKGIQCLYKFKDQTEHDIAINLKKMVSGFAILKGAVEKVHSMPKQGVASSFKFGMSYGFLRGMLVAYAVPFIEPSPQAWQKYLGCLSKGDKNVTKQLAQRKWPSHASSITHGIADALLIAEYTRLTDR